MIGEFRIVELYLPQVDLTSYHFDFRPKKTEVVKGGRGPFVSLTLPRG